MEGDVTTKNTKVTKNCILRGNSSRDDVLALRGEFNPKEMRGERGWLWRAMPFVPFVFFVPFVVASS